MIYKVSYVVKGGEYPGSIKNEYEEPQVGAHVHVGPIECEILEIQQIMPPRGDFTFLHATVIPIKDKAKKEEDK